MMITSSGAPIEMSDPTGAKMSLGSPTFEMKTTKLTNVVTMPGPPKVLRNSRCKECPRLTENKVMLRAYTKKP